MIVFFKGRLIKQMVTGCFEKTRFHLHSLFKAFAFPCRTFYEIILIYLRKFL